MKSSDNLVPRVSHLSAPLSLREGGKMRDLGNEVGHPKHPLSKFCLAKAMINLVFLSLRSSLKVAIYNDRP